jgi:hypothetical protein
MQIAISADPVAALRSQARQQARAALPMRMGRFMVGLWLRHVERRIERALLELDHPGVVGDFMRASRRG